MNLIPRDIYTYLSGYIQVSKLHTLNNYIVSIIDDIAINHI